jgi:uncharacterized protein with beta-barrel porin domain
MNKQVGGAVAISVGIGGRYAGKVIRSAWWSVALAAIGIGTLVGVTPALAQSATWLGTPTVAGPDAGTFDFNANANWTPATAPTGTATFGVSNGPNISFSAGNTTLSGFTFTTGASNYVFTVDNPLIFVGAGGILVNGGSATINNNSSVQFGSSGGTDTATAGNATITNNNSGGSTGFFANTTAGNATITNSNLGNTLFANSSTAGSATITNNNNGITQFGQFGGTDTASAGNATITNNSGGTLFFFANTTAGNATITNNGGILLFGLLLFGLPGSTASGGTAHITNNSGGVIEFFANTTAASATIMNNGSFARASILSFSDASTAGNATITNNGFGFTTFANASTAGSATINNSGLVQFGFGQFGGTDTASAGTATITNNNGSFTQFFANTTAGSAAITNNGGTVQFFNSSTAGSAAITNNSGGFTQFNGTSTAGNATITNNNGTVAFFGQSDGGSAHLINNAGGTIDFSGSSGPLGNGTLNVGSLAGSGTFIVGQQQLVAVSGSLAFTSGALYLVQVNGLNAGRINVAGTATLAGNVEVDVTSRLTQVTTYTILSAGTRNGTFGSVTLEFANGFARDPVLSVVGNNVLLTLQPGLLSPVLPGNASANQVKVASAIDNGLLAGNNLSNAFGAIFNLPGNGLLNGLTQISGETAVGSQQTTFGAMGQFMGVMTDPFLGRGGGGFQTTSGVSGYAEETLGYAAANKTTDAFAMFTKAPSPSQPSPWGQRWNVWASAFGGAQSTSGNAAVGSNNTTSNIAGTAVGADYLLSPHTIAGFALAGGGTSFNVANGGTGRSDLFQMGAYVRHTSGPVYISASLAYGWQDITTNRTVTVAGLDQLRAEFNANAFSGRLEGGYRFVSPWIGGIGITPYAAAQIVTFDLPGYAEQAIVGLNTFASNYSARSVTDPRTEFGVRTDKSFAMSDGVLTLRGRFAWAHDYDPNRSIAATFQSLPGASFVVNGAAQAADSALTTASIEKKWKNGWSAAATFEGEFSGVTSSYAGKGVVRYQW